MLASELIGCKRDGGELTDDELRWLLAAFLRGEVPDYQMSAFLMAVVWRGMSRRELAVMTRAIVESGARLDPGPGPPAVDKHSTGGVGDKISLALAPLLAEAGLRVPMMAGRGLGHTGGTIDKLESIPGFRTELSVEEFRSIVDEHGVSIIAQTTDVAPLDGRLYALRDVTGTVPSIPLIAGSIVSKKVAEGIEALVLDVKCGRGAFMVELEHARQLAETMVELAEEEGLPTTALITDMEAPLGAAVGNALEVREAVEVLRGGGPADVRELTLALGVELLLSSGSETDRRQARARLERLLDGGGATERFAGMIARHGGDAHAVHDLDRLPTASERHTVRSDRVGHLIRVDAKELGVVALELGAGRRRLGDAVDPAVGLIVLRRPGDPVGEGEELAHIHAASETHARRAGERVRAAFVIAERPPSSLRPLIHARVSRAGTEMF